MAEEDEFGKFGNVLTISVYLSIFQYTFCIFLYIIEDFIVGDDGRPVGHRKTELFAEP